MYQKCASDGSETWLMSTDLSCIKTSDHAMIRWMYGIKIKQQQIDQLPGADQN